MSAVEPARPTGPQHRPAAPVIRLADHTDRRPRSTSPPRAGADSLDDPAIRVATTIEALFDRHALTLTDDDTAEVFNVTLIAIEMMLDGALADQVVDAGQHAQLRAMTDGIRDTPNLL